LNLVPAYPAFRCGCKTSVCRIVAYADGSAMLNIPGFTFPVRQFLLEDVLELLQSVLAFIAFMIFVFNTDAKSNGMSSITAERMVAMDWHICLRRVSHFHFYENLVAANLGMRFALWQLRAATRNS